MALQEAASKAMAAVSRRTFVTWDLEMVMLAAHRTYAVAGRHRPGPALFSMPRYLQKCMPAIPMPIC
jgi:hypothetical protein